MRILVTGAAGFAGRHACKELTTHGHTVIAGDIGECPDAAIPCDTYIRLNVCDAQQCCTVVSQYEPEACLHIAGVAFVPNAEASSTRVFEVNTLGTLHILDAALKERSGMRVVVVSSSEVYGVNGTGGAGRILTEESPLRPRNLYGISKASADQCALVYAKIHNLDVLTARPTNHTGPGQRPPFVVPAIIERIRALREVGEGVIKVGNLDSQRRFLDVRDVARAYRLLLEKGRQGEAYNISTAQSLRIGALVDILSEKLEVNVKTEVDAGLYRPTDATAALDLTKIQRDCGWLARYELADTLDAMLCA